MKLTDLRDGDRFKFTNHHSPAWHGTLFVVTRIYMSTETRIQSGKPSRAWWYQNVNADCHCRGGSSPENFARHNDVETYGIQYAPFEFMTETEDPC